MEKVWILGGMRSFIGVKDRMYRNVPAEVLGAEVLRAVIRKYRLAEQDIDFILGGNAVGGGGNMTRLAALTAGIDREVPAVTLDLQWFRPGGSHTGSSKDREWSGRTGACRRTGKLIHPATPNVESEPSGL